MENTRENQQIQEGFSQAEFLLSGLKQLIEKQNDQILHLRNNVNRLQIEKDRQIDILSKNEMIEKEFRLRGLEYNTDTINSIFTDFLNDEDNSTNTMQCENTDTEIMKNAVTKEPQEASTEPPSNDVSGTSD